MIRVVVADDHAVIRRGLRQIVGDATGMTVVGEAENTHELLALVRKEACDVVVLDISMPGRSGIEALKELRKGRPKLPVLILSVYPEDQYAVRALKLGAAGYLTKETAPEELVTAIRKVVSGGRYIGPSLAERLAESLTSDGAALPHESLSEREYQVLRMIGSGQSVSEIAQELALSVKTISTYRARILEKMGMKGNADLIHYAIQHRLVTDPPAPFA